jgi:hypothetical protein
MRIVRWAQLGAEHTGLKLEKRILNFRREMSIPPIVALRELKPRLSTVLGTSDQVHWVSSLTGVRDVLARVSAVALVVSGRHHDDPAVAAIRYQLRQTAPRFAVLPVGAVLSVDALLHLSTPVRWRRLSEVVGSGLAPMGAILVRAAFSLVCDKQHGGGPHAGRRIEPANAGALGR